MGHISNISEQESSSFHIVYNVTERVKYTCLILLLGEHWRLPGVKFSHLGVILVFNNVVCVRCNYPAVRFCHLVEKNQILSPPLYPLTGQWNILTISLSF